MEDDKVAQFVGITAASASTAAFYLDSCGGSVEAAVQAFYDAGGAEAPAAAAAPAPAPGTSAGSSLLAEAAAARAARAAAASGSAPTGAGAAAGPSDSRPRGGAAAPGNVRGLGDIGDEEEEEDDDYNELYVGGDKRWVLAHGCPCSRLPLCHCLQAPACLHILL